MKYAAAMEGDDYFLDIEPTDDLWGLVDGAMEEIARSDAESGDYTVGALVIGEVIPTKLSDYLSLADVQHIIDESGLVTWAQLVEQVCAEVTDAMFDDFHEGASASCDPPTDGRPPPSSAAEIMDWCEKNIVLTPSESMGHRGQTFARRNGAWGIKWRGVIRHELEAIVWHAHDAVTPREEHGWRWAAGSRSGRAATATLARIAADAAVAEGAAP